MISKNVWNCVLITMLCIVVSCCKPKNDENSVTNGLKNGNEINIVQEELNWQNPWLNSPVGSSAVYLTEQGEEKWELLAGMPSPVVKITIQGDEFLGIDEEIKEVNIKFQDEYIWWRTKREKGMDFNYPVKLADDTEILCTRIIIGNQVLIVSEDVPFDGIVEKIVDDKSVLKLLSFTKGSQNAGD